MSVTADYLNPELTHCETHTHTHTLSLKQLVAFSGSLFGAAQPHSQSLLLTHVGALSGRAHEPRSRIHRRNSLAGGGLFGAAQPAAGGGLFGAAQPAAGGGLFGAQPAGAANGTRAAAYQKTVERDGATTGTQPATPVNFISITAMPAYVGKSVEELRWVTRACVCVCVCVCVRDRVSVCELHTRDGGSLMCLPSISCKEHTPVPPVPTCPATCPSVSCKAHAPCATLHVTDYRRTVAPVVVTSHCPPASVRSVHAAAHGSIHAVITPSLYSVCPQVVGLPCRREGRSGSSMLFICTHRACAHIHNAHAHTRTQV